MATGNATVDFGATPASEASVVVPLASVGAATQLEAWFQETSTASNTTADHRFAAVACRLICGNINPGVSFTIYAYCTIGYATGQFTVQWASL